MRRRVSAEHGSSHRSMPNDLVTVRAVAIPCVTVENGSVHVSVSFVHAAPGSAVRATLCWMTSVPDVLSSQSDDATDSVVSYCHVQWNPPNCHWILTSSASSMGFGGGGRSGAGGGPKSQVIPLEHPSLSLVAQVLHLRGIVLAAFPTHRWALKSDTTATLVLRYNWTDTLVYCPLSCWHLSNTAHTSSYL
ncbi:hypothetical protein H257_17884 [Aphanomyces astaci]|uniref:Uncharacterized protein n=1 Tax=Aphanomyces astaci TaxID=112090 RepID=W4FEU7_APHAT|nr:hypothetical protein H257_17884 [Aphanomyces astaci]ETV65346.1 hypothetical protein H257_17884 [Aphanomyces astaci]|eukprot:XP_009845141.1 hypothetical protein H257_17884 [Aphanomyces astaci]